MSVPPVVKLDPRVKFRITSLLSGFASPSPSEKLEWPFDGARHDNPIVAVYWNRYSKS
jgi:hypothetical protein